MQNHIFSKCLSHMLIISTLLMASPWVVIMPRVDNNNDIVLVVRPFENILGLSESLFVWAPILPHRCPGNRDRLFGRGPISHVHSVIPTMNHYYTCRSNLNWENVTEQGTDRASCYYRSQRILADEMVNPKFQIKDMYAYSIPES